jgi:hypothetical protein
MYRKVYLDFQDGSGFRDVSSYVKYDTLQISTRAFSDNWHFAQNTASFSLIYDSVIFPLLHYNEKEVIVHITEVLDVGFNVIFYGRIPPTKSRTYNGILDNTFFNVEAVDELTLLDKAAGDICYRNYQIMNPANKTQSIVHQLCYLCGLSDSQIDSNIVISDVIEAFTPPDPNDLCKDLLDTLLFEYGWVLNMSLGGQISPLRWIQNATTTFEFNETNIIQQIDIGDTLKSYDGAEVIYYELGAAVTTEGNNEMLLYRDGELPYASDGSFAGYPIPNGFSYPPETNVIDETTGLNQIVYQEYDDNAVKYWTNKAIVDKLDYNYKAFSSDFSAIVATSEHRVDWRGDAGLTLTKSVFENRRAELVVNNPTAGYLSLYYLNVYGKVLYKTAERKAIVKNVTTAEDLDKYVSTFIFSKTIADVLAIKLAAQHLINSTQYGFISEENRPVGEFVRVLLGDGTDQVSIVTEKAWNESTEQYRYRVRAYSEDMGTLTAQTFSANPVAPVPEVIAISVAQSDINVSANVDGSSPILTNAYFDVSILRDGVDDTPGWSITVSVNGISGSFGTGEFANRWTVSAFASDATLTGSVQFTASRAGFADRIALRRVSKLITTGGVTASTAPSYKGRYDHAHPASPNLGDWWTVYHTDDTAPQRGVWWNNDWTYERITTASSTSIQAKFVEALTDVAWAESNSYGVAADYGIATLFQTLGVVTAFVNELFAQSIVVPNGGRIQYETGSGVQKRAVRLHDEKIDWVDIPDTVPASNEQLRARIGRLGVGAILYDGDHLAKCDLSPELSIILATGAGPHPHPAIIFLNDGSFLIAYSLSNKLLEYRSATGSTVTIDTLGSPMAQGHCPKYFSRNNGDRMLVYEVVSDPTYGTAIISTKWDGSGYTSRQKVASIIANDENVALFETPDNRLFAMWEYIDGANKKLKINQYNHFVADNWDATPIADVMTVGTSTMSASISFAHLHDNHFVMAYKNSNAKLATIKIYMDIGSSGFYGPSVETSYYINQPCVTVDVSDNIQIYFNHDSTGDLGWVDYTGAEKSTYNTIDASDVNAQPNAVQTTNGEIAIVYLKIAGVVYSIRLAVLQRYAQIGAGIIESGSNTNGSWIKYSDGTMECWKTINACVGGGVSTAVTLPVTFIFDGSYGVSDNSIGIGKSQVPSNGTGGYFDVWMQVNGYTLVYRSQYAQAAYIHVIGRWK